MDNPCNIQVSKEQQLPEAHTAVLALPLATGGGAWLQVQMLDFQPAASGRTWSLGAQVAFKMHHEGSKFSGVQFPHITNEKRSQQ